MEIGRGQRGGKRGREEEKEQNESRRQRWRASAGRGGINFLDRQEQLWFTACRGMVRYKERFLKQIDDPTQESSSLLQHDAGECTCASKLPYALMNLLLHMSVDLDWEQS